MTVSPGDVWVVRMPAHHAKLVVKVIDIAITGVRVRVVTQEPEGNGTWYETHSIEWCERLARGSVEFGYDTPWPLFEIVSKLAEATEHLMVGHNCDAHGHELFMDAHARARAWLKAQT